MSIVKAPDNDHEAELNRWMDEYGDMLVRLACMMLRDPQLAQDAVQDTFVKVWKSRFSFRRECSEKTYLTGILLNTCRDYLRTAWMRRVDRSRPAEELPEPFSDAPSADKTVTEAVLRLPAKLRETVLLRYWQDMKIKDIGDSLRVSPETVKARLRRANQKLRKELEGWYYNEE